LNVGSSGKKSGGIGGTPKFIGPSREGDLISIFGREPSILVSSMRRSTNLHQKIAANARREG